MISEHSVTVSYPLTEDLWRRFYEAHYAADASLKMRYFWGALCIVIGAFVLVFGSKLVSALLFLTGFYSVLSRHIFLLRSVAAARKHPFFGKEITVSMTPEGVTVRSGNSGYMQAWQNFSRYRKIEPGYMLYLDKNAFFFIPKSACSDEDEKRIDRFLRETLKAPGEPE